MPRRLLLALALYVGAANAAAAADTAAAKRSAALHECQSTCNALDTKSGAFPQMKAHCGGAYTAKTAKASCLKGFKLGLSIGCDFVCEAGGAPKPGTSSGAALLASVRAARDAACAGHGDGDATAACASGFDEGARTYFETHPTWDGGGGFFGGLWSLFKFVLVLAVIYRVVTDPRVKHQLPLPAQHSVHRIEKALSPWLRKGAKLGALAVSEGTALVNAQLAARRKAAAAAAASGLPGGLKAFGTMSFGDADVAGAGKDFLPTTGEFPEPLGAEVARAFTRTFTANDGSLRRMTAKEVAAVTDAAPVTSRTLVAGGFSNTVCAEALREFTVETLPPMLAEAGVDSYPKAVFAALAKCLTPNVIAKLLRDGGLLAGLAAAPSDADARDAELMSGGHVTGLCHTLCVGQMRGKPSVHVVSTAFVGGDTKHRAKLVTSNLLQSYPAGTVCKVNYAVRKTAYRSGAQAAGECASELRAAVERGAWGEFLSADGEGGADGKEDGGKGGV